MHELKTEEGGKNVEAGRPDSNGIFDTVQSIRTVGEMTRKGEETRTESR